MSTKTNHYFAFTYSARDSDTGDTEMDFSLNFENPKSSKEIADKITSWLTAIGQSAVLAELQNKK